MVCFPVSRATRSGPGFKYGLLTAHLLVSSPVTCPQPRWGFTYSKKHQPEFNPFWARFGHKTSRSFGILNRWRSPEVDPPPPPRSGFISPPLCSFVQREPEELRFSRNFQQDSKLFVFRQLVL
ncbi:hypothetical protein AGIG_G24914 [Arapaima gigas]